MSSISHEHYEIQLPLERCRDLLSQFIEHAPAPIAMFDREMKYIMASRRFATDYNLKSQDLIGRSHYEVFPEISERWKEIHRRCLGGATERAEEEPFPRADGTLDWVRWEIQPWYDESGAIGGIILFSEVITERKRAEAALRASDRRYRTLADNLPDLIYRADPDTLVASFVNPAIEKIYGYTAEEWLRDPLLWERTIHPDDKENVLHLFRHARQHGTDASIEYRIIRKDGNQHWVTDRFSWERDIAGRIIALNGIVLDITERKQAEEAIQKSEQMLFTVLETAAFAVALTSLPDGMIVYANSSFEKLFGFTKQEVIGKTSLELGIHRDPEARARGLAELQAHPSMRELELGLYTKSGESRICSVNLDVVEIRGQPYILSTTQDITERKQAEEALRDSERRYHEFVTDLPVAAYATDVTGRITLYNDAAVTLWGRRPESSNRWWGGSSKLYTPNGTLLSYRQCPMALATREHRSVRGFEAVFEQLDGRRVNVLANITPVTDDSGRVVGATNVLLDITERKRAEEALYESEIRFRATFEQAAVGIAHVAPDGRWLRVNKKLCNIVGYSREELLTKTFQDITHPDDLAADLEFVRQMLAGEIQTYSMEKRYVRKDGSLVWINLTVALVRTLSGEPDYFISAVEDITERKQAERALAEAERLRGSILESMAEGIHGLDSTGHIMFENPASLKMFGWKEHEMIGQHAHTLMHHHRPDGSVYPVEECPIYHTLDDGRVRHVDNELFFRQDGSSFPVEYTCAALTDDSGLITGVVVGFRDVTKRKRAEDAVRQSRDRLRELTARLVEAEETERRNLSRELHDRVGQMLTALSLDLGIIQGQLSEDAKQKIGPRLEDALTLIQETTTCVRDVMADLYPSVLTDFGLATALRSHSKRFTRQTAIAVRIEEVGDGGSRPPAQIETVLFRVAQEALTNAARHAGANQIRVTVDTAAQAARLTIEDDGRGFDPRAVVTDERHGWGLRTMRERIEGIGGKFHVDSSPGLGTRIIAEIAVPHSSATG